MKKLYYWPNISETKTVNGDQELENKARCILCMFFNKNYEIGVFLYKSTPFSPEKKYV